jgi:hypothetical protein
MWWAIGVGIWLVLLLVVLSLCRVAAIGNRRQDELSPHEAEERKRAA